MNKILNLIDKAFLLKKTRLFGSLDLDLLLTIADKTEMKRLKENEVIFHIDQEASLMYLIVEGTVSINDSDQKRLAILRERDFFGDESIFNQKPRAYQAVCNTPVSLLTISRSHLLSIINECPSVAIALLEAYTDKMDFHRK